MSPAALSHSEQARRNFDIRALIGAASLCVLQVATSYGHGYEVAEVVAILVAKVVFNTWVDRWLISRIGGTPGERVRIAGNTLGLLLMGHLQAWPLALWLWLPFNAMITDENRARQAWLNLAFLVVVVDAVALMEGVSVALPLGFSALTGICYLLAQARQGFIESMLREREEQNAQLQQAHLEMEALHQRAVMQEKLSSLGLLSAGIAHEINNPMSYVTSNLKDLMADLPRLGTTPELLEEYRRDILPATLDGLRRVNSIVADLRRFARGDPESLVEYDLNEEIRAAARIAQSRFTHDRELRLELAQLPHLLGRPRQIAQVLVNLMINAAEAIGETGSVTVTTALDGERIRITVRDTGVGMDAVTLKNLFQPFFTTKQVGAGMGLGLAVAHGIVRAHGGTISVESEPGRGTCFTLSLAQFPPPNLPLGQPFPEERPAAHAASP
ncbi:sensor histidine kinase [Pyxidicoccus sp. MSG2]|uniref:sensor histidine kinase n=1 Tax=Pyxidicoccus sp. MSG2 TaxID=2996790 RepID=UPI002270780C|nr:ATP-binding protein [Pyxidicoccus sp. MSG2]MCY1022461.1 ATP-binding protein [Pyxidicoccus sp. MSG2]